MHIIHNEIWAPKITYEKMGDFEAKIAIKPLPSGYWVTLWNSIRRVALSSIPGSRVTWIKVKWITHEYAIIPGIKDSVLDIMLNLKNLTVEKTDAGIEWISLKKNTKWRVTAWDIKVPSNVKILNPDLYITEIDRDGFEIDMSIRVEKWVGYLGIEELKEREDSVDVLLLDANFSPVVNVKYDVNNVRVWDTTNLDSLEIYVKTNGAMDPQNVLKFSAKMLESYFSVFNETMLQVDGEYIWDIKQILEREKAELKSELEKETYTPIEILGLSPRTLNALVNWDILSVEQLTKCTEAKLSSIKWFWKKAMTEIKLSLKERGLKLLWDD